MQWQLVVSLSLLGISLAGCGTDTIQEVDPNQPVDDSAVDDDALSAESGADGSVVDSGSEETSAIDGTIADAISDSGKSDTGSVDAVAPGDSSSVMFACGTETCSAKFQFCHKDTAPGVCPPSDAGVCPAGCPGCPELARHCESLPSKCFALPSCMCLVGEVCKFSGACDETSGFTIGCKAI